MAIKMQRYLRYIVLKHDINFNLNFICSTCGYLLENIKDVRLGDVASLVDDLIVRRYCSLCSEGKFIHVPAMLYNETANIRFNASAIRIYEDHHYLSEAYNNPCSTNICHCNKYDPYLMIASENPEYPFVCGVCSKLFIDATFHNREGLNYRSLRPIQVNVFRDYFARYFDWDTKFWVEPANSHSRFRPREVHYRPNQ